VADTGECLSSKSISGNRTEVLKLLKFGGRETFTQNWKILFLVALLASGQPASP
jgi:hypothetical protein